MKRRFLQDFLKVQRSILFVVLFSLLLLTLLGWVIFQSKNDVETGAGWILKTYALTKEIESTNSLVSESGIALRTYLVAPTPDKEQAILALQNRVNDKVNKFGTLLYNDPIQKTNLSNLHLLLEQNQALQNQLILNAKKSKSTDYKQFLKAVDVKPKLLTKGLLYTIIEQERSFLKGRVTNFKSDYKNSIYAAVAGCVVSFILIIVILIQINKDIALRKKTEEESHINELKYRSLIENAGAVMFTTNNKGNMLFVSKKASQLTGFSVEELTGSHFSVLIDPDWIETITYNYVEQFKNRVEETLIEFPIITKNKEIKWVEQSAILLHDNDKLNGFQCIVRDISEKKIMQMKLEESALTLKENQRIYQSVLDNTPLVVYIKDIRGRYLMINKKFRELFNVTDEMALNKTNFDFENNELSVSIKALEDKIIQTRKPIEVEELRESTKGPINLLSIKFPLLDENNKVIGISGISTEITEKVNYQKQLIAAKQDAENAKMLQEQFLANMSHEIRTPMNGIQGMINLLLETPLNDQQKEFAVIVKRSVNNLLVIINDILDFSKIKAGKLTIEKIEFDYREILDNIQAMFAHRIKKKELALNINIDANVPSILVGDPYRLNQVLVNLTGNAIKFTEYGSVTINISVKTKTDKDAVIVFSIKDTGVGIAAENLSTIFDSFTQASTDTARKYGGTGLGLTISKQLTQLQGGTISAKSNPGEGSEFIVELPFGYKKQAGSEPGNPTSEFDYSAAFTGKRFLVVEDNEVNQKLICYVLEKVGVKVDVAANGSEAIAFLRKKINYQLIIMDLQMPVMDGYSTTNYIRRIMEINTPIIAMTATAMKGEQKKCLQIGMNDYMSKPFEFGDLYRRIYKLLSAQSNTNLTADKIAV